MLRIEVIFPLKYIIKPIKAFYAFSLYFRVKCLIFPVFWWKSYILRTFHPFSIFSHQEPCFSFFHHPQGQNWNHTSYHSFSFLILMNPLSCIITFLAFHSRLWIEWWWQNKKDFTFQVWEIKFLSSWQSFLIFKEELEAVCEDENRAIE